MSTLGQDIGTVAILLLVACSLIIRARHFCTYGKEALFVVLVYVLEGATLRICSTHELLEPEAARTINGYFAGALFVIQLSNLWLGELTLRKTREESLS